MSTIEFTQIFFDVKNWDTQLNLFFLSLCLLYLVMVRTHLAGWQKTCFLLSVLVYYISIGSPIVLLAHELFSVHMLQMSLQYFVVPPLLLMGLPTFVLRPPFKIRGVRSIISFCTRPLISLFLFNGLISLYHAPVIFNALMSKGIYHVLSHILLFLTSLFMWWPILAPLSELNRLKPLHRIGLIFGNGILLTPACAIITFTDKALYPLYSKMSELVPVISPLHDQQLGGVIMKITQEIVYITAICFVFFSWVIAERKKENEELDTWKKEHLKGENPA